MNIAAVWHILRDVQDVDPTAKLALVSIAAHCRRGETTCDHLSLAELASDLALTDRTAARKVLHRAVDAGHLAVDKAPNDMRICRLLGVPQDTGGVSSRVKRVSPRPQKGVPQDTLKEKERSIDPKRAAAQRLNGAAALVDKAPPDVAPAPPRRLAESMGAVLEALEGAEPPGRRRRAGVPPDVAAAARRALKQTGETP